MLDFGLVLLGWTEMDRYTGKCSDGMALTQASRSEYRLQVVSDRFEARDQISLSLSGFFSLFASAR